MNTTSTLRAGLLLLVSTVGCGGRGTRHEEEPEPARVTIADLLPAGAERVFKVQEAIDKALAESKSIVLFRSWNGRWIGTDCDADIQLRPGKAAVLVEYGVSVQAYSSTYSINEAAELTLTLPKYGDKWPAMQMYRDKADLLLVPTDASTGFIMGNRGGATIFGGQGSFWPLRQVPAKERFDLQDKP